MQKIRLESVRLDTVTNICQVSDSVFDANKMANTGMVAWYVPAAEVVVFQRGGHSDHIVTVTHTLTMVSADNVPIEDWGRKEPPEPKPPKPDKPDTPVAPPHDGVPPGHGGTPPGQDKPDKPTPPGHDKPKRGPGRPPKK